MEVTSENIKQAVENHAGVAVQVSDRSGDDRRASWEIRGIAWSIQSGRATLKKGRLRISYTDATGRRWSSDDGREWHELDPDTMAPV